MKGEQFNGIFASRLAPVVGSLFTGAAARNLQVLFWQTPLPLVRLRSYDSYIDGVLRVSH